jgi:very-short-patch-repair endonuclease
VDITVAGQRCHGRPRVRVHRCKLDPDDVTVHRGVPITTPMRALLDFAEDADVRQVTRAVEASDRLGLFDGRAIGALLDRSFGRRGVKPMRIVLGRYDESHVFTRSDLEDLALDLVNEHALPRPVVNAKVGEYEVDLLWREQKVVVEADSWTFHGTRAAFERDRQRDADLQARGFRVVRVTWRQARDEAAWIAGRLRAVLALTTS